MRTSTSIVALVAVLAHSVVADKYTHKGNVDMEVGTDGPVHYGDKSPWFVLGTLSQHCKGQTCNADPWTMKTDLANDAAGTNSPTNVNSGHIKVTVVDATISKDDDLAGMIQALKDLAKQKQIHSKKTEYICKDDSDPPPSRFMRRNEARAFGCNNKKNGSPMVQYSSAATWYIRINNPNGSLRSELRVKVEAGVNDDKLSKTICTDLAAAGAALAGLFTGGAAAAAGMTLAGLACGDL